MLAELTVAGGLVLLLAGTVLLTVALRERRRVRVAAAMLHRAAIRAREARRASVTAGGLQLVDHLFGVVARDRETDPDTAG